MRHVILTILIFLTCVTQITAPKPALAYDVVIDPAAIAKLVQQIEQFRSMIATLEGSKQLLIQQFEIMAKDNTNLGRQEMMRFLMRYRNTFAQIQNAINGYQGLMQQIGRLDEIFPRLDLGLGAEQICLEEVEQPGGTQTCKEDLELGTLHRVMKKQMLITRQQMKHALKVGSEVLNQLPERQSQLEYALGESRGAVGMLQAAQSSNEILGLLGQQLQTLSVQMGTFVQAYSTKELQEQGKEAIATRRRYDFLKNVDAPRDDRGFNPLKFTAH